MNTDHLLRLVSLVLAFAFVGGASAAHAALFKLNKGRLRHLASEGVPQGRVLLSFAEDAYSFETSLMGAIAIVLSLGSALAATTITEIGADFSRFLLGLAALLLLLWAVVAGRSTGACHPEGTLMLLRWPVAIVHGLMRPPVALMRRLTRRTNALEQPNPAPGSYNGDEELRMIVDAVEEETTLEPDEKEMIYGIVEMGERTAREIMVPRVDIVAVEASEPLRVVLDRINERGHSRIPIFEETVDNVVGVVYAKDLLSYMVSGSLDEPALTLAREARFIPESKKMDELLHDMQRHKVHMVIVLDEYGGTAGLVTIEDLLEEIVGEIQDEYDVEDRSIEKVSDEEAIFDARVSLHDVNETLSLVLGDGEYETLGGLVYDRLGKIPKVGDEVHVEGACVKVLSVAGQRIKQVRVRVEAPEALPQRNGNE